jgi:hypothetical protein
MHKQKSYNLCKIFFVFFLIFIFFTVNFNRISYGLPFFLNSDENAFLYSNLSYISFFTGFKTSSLNPIYAPLISIVLILKSIFLNEMIINSLSIDEIKSKIYFNPELLIFYGRIASLITTSISIFFLYLIFKKLRIKFIIYSVLLVTFASSLVALDTANVFGKSSYFLLFFLIQLYFLIKYLLKIKNFNIKSYIIFALLGSIAWGINYWPAFISIYSVLFLHFQKFRFSKIKYLSLFFLIFTFFGPIMDYFFLGSEILNHVFTDSIDEIEYNIFDRIIKDFVDGLKILYFSEKNFLLLLLLAPFFLINKNVKYKKEFLIISFVIFEPIIVFGIAQGALPQLRYFVGSICVILILVSLIFNEFYKTSFKYLILIFFVSNFFFIYKNINLNKETNQIAKNHSFYNFNESIKSKDRSKILYMVDLGFQESLDQNLLYLELYENDLIKKSQLQEEFVKRIEKKIKKINNTKNVIIHDPLVKENIIYFNYTFFQIDDLNNFFNFIKNKFDYVVIEESDVFYLSAQNLQTDIKNYVKKNFLFEKIHSKENKIFINNYRSLIHYNLNVLSVYDELNYDDKLEKIYGQNYSLYKIK